MLPRVIIFSPFQPLRRTIPSSFDRTISNFVWFIQVIVVIGLYRMTPSMLLIRHIRYALILLKRFYSLCLRSMP